MEFVEFPKIARLVRPCIITEKIDGTNAQVFIGEDGTVLAGSRTRWITPADDNYGFAAWVTERAGQLRECLGADPRAGAGAPALHAGGLDVSRWLVLVALALVGCGSDGGGEEDGPVECTEQEGLAPCCDQTPLTADDCPEGTAFSSDELGECCKDTAGGHGICRAAAEDGSTVSRSESGVRSILCDWTTGREVAESDLAGACVVACYDDDGHKVARSGCDSSRVSDRAPACPGYE